MTEQVIPAEAVESAALSIHRAHPFQSLSICRAVARAALEAAMPHILAPVLALANQWHEWGESDIAVSKTMQDEDIAMVLLTDGATMVENARHIRNAIAGTK